MTDYVKTTDFAAKDSLLTGNPAKLVKGVEIDDEFNNLATAIASKADSSAVGDVVGPASATANSLARFDGTTGKLLKDGAVIGTDVQAYDVDTAKLDVAQAWTAQQTFKELKDTVHTITDGAAFEIDPANGSIQVVTLGANRTPAATNFEAGQTVLLGIDDGSAYSVTWSTVAVTWVKSGGTGAAPSLATSGFTWVVLWKQGTTIFGSIVGSP